MTAARRWTHYCLAIAATTIAMACRGSTGETRPAVSPSAHAAELIAADRSFGAAVANTDMVSALLATFASDVVLLSRGVLVQGRNAAEDSLRAGTPDPRARFRWSPIRVGISADGTHGFTYGYTTLIQPDGAMVPGKYVAYWTREPEGWRVSAYKRVPRPAGDVAMAELPPSVPAAPASMLAVSDRERSEASLRAAEIAFSDHAVAHGLGPAFQHFGAADAVNVGGPADTTFVRGPKAISEAVSEGSTGVDISWAPDVVRVAGSGDLGVSLGYITIRPAAAGAQQPARRVAYLTVWRRDGVAGPWRYVAE